MTTLSDLVDSYGMDVETTCGSTSIGVTRNHWRIEALRWCFAGCQVCTCSDWTVLAAPAGHPRDVIVRRNVTGTTTLAAVLDNLVTIAGGHVTQMLDYGESR